MPRPTQVHGFPEKLTQRTLTNSLRLSPNKTTSKTSSQRKRKPATPSPEESTESVDQAASDSDVGAIQFETIQVSDEDALPRQPKRKRSRVVADNLEYMLGDDEENIGVPVRWQRKSKMKVVEDSDDESQPPRRKLIKGVRPPTPDEDEDKLDETQILESRLRRRGQKTKYQRALERIKSPKGRNLVLESPSEDEMSGESAVKPFEGARQDDSGASTDLGDGDGQSQSSRNVEDEEDEDDENFIVEDDDIAPVELPVAFRMNAHQDLAHRFKVICQLFVHMVVRPLPERRPFVQHVLNKEYFSVPLQDARRKLLGMRDSLVTSSVWTSDFKKKLEKYPEFTLIRMGHGEPGCDACHLGGRISTLIGRVSGTPYDKDDFEDLTDDESDENTSDEDTDKRSFSLRKDFHLGRFCAKRTRVYHKFNHWEYSLYKTLQEEVTTLQDPSQGFVKVAYAGGTLPSRDLEDADKIMDWLDQRGIIEMEWHKIRKMMESATNLEIKRGDADDD